MNDEKSANVGSTVAEGRKEFDSAREHLSAAKDDKLQLKSKKTEADNAVSKKNNELQELKSKLSTMETYKNNLGLFKRKERKQYEQELIPEINRQIQSTKREHSDAKNKLHEISQLLTKAEKTQISAQKNYENAEKKLKQLEFEVNAKSGDEAAQYQLVMSYYRSGDISKAKEFAAKDGPGYKGALLEIEQLELAKIVRAQDEIALAPAHDATKKLVALYKRYKEIGHSELTKGVDKQIKEINDALATINSAYKRASEEDKPKAIKDLQNFVSAIKKTSERVKEAIKHAEDRIQAEKSVARLRAFQDQNR